MKAVGHLLNAVRGLESVVGRMVHNGDRTMLDVSRELGEAARIIMDEAAWSKKE